MHCSNSSESFDCSFVSTETLENKQTLVQSIEFQLASKYAPEIRLHSEELYYPASVEWFLQRCDLRFSTGKGDQDPVIIDTITDIDCLINQSFKFKEQTFFSMQTPNKPNHSPFYLRVKDQTAIFGQKDLNNVPVYVRFFYPEEDKLASNYVDIQYYFFYGYNGALKSFLPTVGIHEGDWEHITVRVRLDGIFDHSSIMAIYYSAHGGEGRWYLNCAGKEGDDSFVPSASLRSIEDTGRGIGYFLNNQDHPIVYSSKFLHASYPTSGRQRRFLPLGLIDDYTDDKGSCWSTWNSIVIMPEISDICHISRSDYQPLNDSSFSLKHNYDIRWMLFNGQWGRKGRKSYGESDGPYGPGMKVYFRKGDCPITLQNCIGHAPGNAGIWNNNSTSKTISSSTTISTIVTTTNENNYDDTTEGLCFELKVFSQNFVQVD